MKKILVADDEINMCRILKIILEKDGYSVITANSGKEAIHILKTDSAVDLIISDLRMPEVDGLAVLEFIKETKKDIPIILITAYGSIEIAVEAMKKGAADFITKPFDKNVIRHIIRRVFHISELEEENEQLRNINIKHDFIYKSKVMTETMAVINKIARVPRPILIQGESGSGKEVIAKQIHLASSCFKDNNDTSPFISINCPAVPESLLESELFGYQKGSFTGAAKDFKGKIRLSEGGTLFLDEIGELSLNVQPKLLRFLENKKIMPLGGNTEYSVNTRVICATNKNLKEMVDKGLFREDLFYRINTIIIEVPPLRERKDDILPLADYFLNNLSKELGEQKKHLPDSIIKSFLEYKWPGNVRELRNIIERAVLLSSSKNISIDDIPVELRYNNLFNENSSNNQIESSERKMLLSTLIITGWNISSAAKMLGLSRSAMRYKITKYKLDKNLNIKSVEY